MGFPPGTMRLVPDVASAADPSEGALVIVNGSSLEIGGTSWSAPTWAGFCALINQHRGTPLGFLNPKIYPLMGTSALRDITSGSNGTFSAGVGYDQVTGIGVPDVTALLAASLTSSPNPVVPAQLSGQVVTLGQPATFFVVGAGAPTLSYQWRRGGPGRRSCGPALHRIEPRRTAGRPRPMLVVDGTTSAMTGDQFQCIVTNSSASATSSAASLTVNKVGVTTLSGWPGSSGGATRHQGEHRPVSPAPAAAFARTTETSTCRTRPITRSARSRPRGWSRRSPAPPARAAARMGPRRPPSSLAWAAWR